MIEAIAIAGLEGLAHALGERLGKGKGNAVEIKALAEALRDMGEKQARTEVAVADLMTLFQQLVQESDGFVVSRRRLRARTEIRFQATDSSPTLGDALLHLDANIRGLKGVEAGARDAGGTGTGAGTGTVPGRRADPNTVAGGGPSILAGLDEEIQSLRVSGGKKPGKAE